MTMEKHYEPPGLGAWLLDRARYRADGDILLGDLEEEYQLWCRHRGERQARRWYWRQVVTSLPVFTLQSIYWGIVMLKHYLKIAFRTLSKQKGHSLINVAGLALGLAPCILALLFIQHELSVGRSHDKADQIYRVVLEQRLPDGESTISVTPPLWAQMLKDEFPEVLDATRFHPGQPHVQYGSKRFVENKYAYADANVFDIFTIPLLQGNPETALVEPYSIVLTEAMARKYFGDEDPMGQTLEIDHWTFFGPDPDGTDLSGDHTVTGIMQARPRNALFDFEGLMSLSTMRWLEQVDPASLYRPAANLRTYVLLPKDYPPQQLEAKFPGVTRKYMAALVEQGTGMSWEEMLEAGYGFFYHLQPLQDIYFHRIRGWGWEITREGNARQLYFFALIALVLLVIACINFINLTTARSAVRAREVGVRKVVGAHRWQLARQFLGEALVLSMIASLLALVLAALALPAFGAFAGREVGFSWSEGWPMWLGLLGLALGVGLLAGSYPAFFLSSFRPVAVLKGTLHAGPRSAPLRNGLVVVQFVISIGLIVATLVVTQQLSHMRSKELGFDKEHVVLIDYAVALKEFEEENGELRYAAGSNPGRYAPFKQELLRHPNVIAVAAEHSMFSAESSLEGPSWNRTPFRPAGRSEDEAVEIYLIYADADIVAALGLEPVAGGNLVERNETPEGLVLNESAAKLLETRYGWTNPVGQRLEGTWNNLAGDSYNGTLPVIGAVKDFHYKSLHTTIEPLVLSLFEGSMQHRWANQIPIRIGPGDVPGTLAHLEETWKHFTNGLPLEYSFLDEYIGRSYESEARLQTIFRLFSGLAIFIACLGVFGLAAFMAERRTKEIGIRKVLGATVTSVVLLLSKDFVRLVGIAFVVTSPLVYLAMRRWLEGFAYRIDLGVGVLVLAGLMALLIALMTVSYQSIKASRANPVESLRYE